MRIDSRESRVGGEGHIRRRLQPSVIQSGQEVGLDPSGKQRK